MEKETITKYIMTHRHIDHVGCGKWLSDNCNVVTYLSKADDKLQMTQPKEDNRQECWKEFEIDRYLCDDDVIECGDKCIKVVATPGHTPGCMSFVFPVFVKGEKHVAALFGGETPSWNSANGKEQQIESADKFVKVAKCCHTDVALTNHNALDNGLERIAYSKVRMSFQPNIYILG